MSYEDYGHIDNMDMDVIDSYGGFSRIKEKLSRPNVIATILIAVVVIILGVALVGPIAGLVKSTTTEPTTDGLVTNITIEKDNILPTTSVFNMVGSFNNPTNVDDGNYNSFINASEDNGSFVYTKTFTSDISSFDWNLFYEKHFPFYFNESKTAVYVGSGISQANVDDGDFNTYSNSSEFSYTRNYSLYGNESVLYWEFKKDNSLGNLSTEMFVIPSACYSGNNYFVANVTSTTELKVYCYNHGTTNWDLIKNYGGLI